MTDCPQGTGALVAPSPPAVNPRLLLTVEIPQAARQATRWLVYRLEPDPKHPERKPRKVPYYVDGSRRQGALDTQADWDRLCSFEQMLDALDTGQFSGAGFALGPDGTGNHWQGIDLDHIDERPALAALGERLPGYVEASPSGTGLHAIGYGLPFKSLGSNQSGIEAYAAGRYFTVTGDAIRGDIEDLSAFVVETLAPLHDPGRDTTRQTARPVPGLSFHAKVNSKALQALSAWVPALLPKARPYHDGFRVSSADLGRNLEEDLSILPAGIKDFGEEAGKTPIDLVLDWGPAKDATEAALWLCSQLGIDPATLGWKIRQAAPPRENARPEPPPDPVTVSEYPWPEPGDIASPTDPAPYPLTAFPPVAQNAIREYADFGRQPLSLVAGSALAQMSLAAQPLADVARNEFLISPVSLFLMIVAASGERKTAADKQFGRAIRAWVRRERDARMDAYRRSVAMAADHKSRMDGVKTRIKSLSSKEDEESTKELERLQERLIELEQNPIVPVPLPAATHEDVNPASLAYAVATGWPSCGLFSDEAGAVIGSQGLGDEHATGLLSLMNILWDGRDFIPTRKQAAVAELRGRRFTTFLMLQPDLLPKLIAKGARNLGFLARFLLSAPVSTMGTRLYREPPADWRALNDFDLHITRLLELELPIDRSGEDHGARMILAPPVMRLDDAAKQMWVDFHDAVERELCQFGEFATVQDVASKTAENAVRIAAVFKLFDQGRVGRLVERGYMAGGIAVASWHLHEARRLFLEADTPPELQDARELSIWLAGKGRELENREGEPLIDQEGMIAVRDIARVGPNRVRDTTRRDDALDLLIEAGHVRRVDVGKKRSIQVNPRLLA